MGCCESRDETMSSLDTSFIDIPLLNKPKVRRQLNENNNNNYFSIDNYTTSQIVPQRRPSYEGGIFDQTQLSVAEAPEIELSRQQKFNECFSHIEVNTFQNIPIASVQSHLSIPRVENQIYSTHEFDDYARFMEQVLNTLTVLLTQMNVEYQNDITIEV